MTMSMPPEFGELLDRLVERPDRGDEIVRIAVFALIEEQPLCELALHAYDQLVSLENRLGKVELHERVWDNAHTTLIVAIKDKKKRYLDLLHDVMTGTLREIKWLALSADA